MQESCSMSVLHSHKLSLWCHHFQVLIIANANTIKQWCIMVLWYWHMMHQYSCTLYRPICIHEASDIPVFWSLTRCLNGYRTAYTTRIIKTVQGLFSYQFRQKRHLKTFYALYKIFYGVSPIIGSAIGITLYWSNFLHISIRSNYDIIIGQSQCITD